MNTLNNFLAGIAAEPLEETGWGALADWLEENDDPRRGELLRSHRDLLRTCCEPEAHPERGAWQARVVELIAEGVRPCVPQKTVKLPGGVPMTLSFIPPGSFLMGGTVEGYEKPVHKVTVTKGFYLGIHAVTQSQWKAVMGNNPSHFRGRNRPVEQVSWDNCQEYCKKLTSVLKGRVPARLPSEAEWEYACRAGTTSDYHFGDAINSDLVNYTGYTFRSRTQKGRNRRRTTDVGSFRSNAWGLYDMHGNVWEWCEDRYGESSGGEETDPHGQPNVVSRGLRGGSWRSHEVDCGAAAGMISDPAADLNFLGFRLLLPMDF